MLKNVACAVVVLGLSIGFAMAEEIKGRITKIDSKSVTVANKDNKEGKSYDFAKDVKFFKISGDNKEEIKSVENLKVGEKTRGTVVTNDDGKVTQVVVGGKKKKDS